MSTFKRLTEVFNTSKEIPFNDSTRIIFLSDCHRGDGSKADDFLCNRDLYSNILQHYYHNGFTYIEIGDGDELWKNSCLKTIIRTHIDVFLMLQKFYNEGRLHMIYGNHDMMKKYEWFVKKNLYSYYDFTSKTYKPLFDGIKAEEGLVLKHTDTGNKIFVVHGHQGDLMYDRLWWLSCFLTRFFWRPLACLGFTTPINPAANYSRRSVCQNNIIHWASYYNQPVIAGHTHYAAFPENDKRPYFNSGCCVYPGHITGIEMADGEISLVKWSQKENGSGLNDIERKVLAGPEKLESFFHTV